MLIFVMAACLLVITTLPCVVAAHQAPDMLKQANIATFPRFMDPQRSGNENFPQPAVRPPPSQNKGLIYPPWQGTDSDDLTYPTFNIHYDFEPKDWLKKMEDAKDRIHIRKEVNQQLHKTEQDVAILQQFTNKQNQEIQEATEALLEQALQGKSHLLGTGNSYQRLPDAFLTGSSLGTGKMEAIKRLLEKEYRKKHPGAKTDEAYTSLSLSSSSTEPDIYMHIAEEYATS